MSTTDSRCIIVPYFKVKAGRMDEFKTLCEQFVEKTSSEELCLYYGFCFNNDVVHCREAYKNATGILAHLDNVGELLGKSQELAELTKFEIHGPQSELNLLQEPLAALSPDYFVLEME